MEYPRAALSAIPCARVASAQRPSGAQRGLCSGYQDLSAAGELAIAGVEENLQGRVPASSPTGVRLPRGSRSRASAQAQHDWVSAKHSACHHWHMVLLVSWRTDTGLLGFCTWHSVYSFRCSILILNSHGRSKERSHLHIQAQSDTAKAGKGVAPGGSRQQSLPCLPWVWLRGTMAPTSQIFITLNINLQNIAFI